MKPSGYHDLIRNEAFVCQLKMSKNTNRECTNKFGKMRTLKTCALNCLFNDEMVKRDVVGEGRGMRERKRDRGSERERERERK